MVFTVDLRRLAEITDAQLDFYNVHIHADQAALLKWGLSVLSFLLSSPSGALAASISSYVSLLQTRSHSLVLRPGWRVTCLWVDSAQQEGPMASPQLVRAPAGLAVGTARSIDATPLLRTHDTLRFMFVCGMPRLFIMWKKQKACQSTSLMRVCLMTSAAS